MFKDNVPYFLVAIARINLYETADFIVYGHNTIPNIAITPPTTLYIP